MKKGKELYGLDKINKDRYMKITVCKTFDKNSIQILIGEEINFRHSDKRLKYTGSTILQLFSESFLFDQWRCPSLLFG